MSVTARARPPSPAAADALEALREEALIKEARARARRRRQRYAAALAVATALVCVGVAFALRPDTGGAQPSAAAQPLAPAAPTDTRSTIVFATSARYITATLYSINADGTGLRRLFNWKTLFRVGHWASRPALSPDGRQVAFQAGTPRQPEIALANLDGTGVHWLNGGEHPTWSPDGTHIAYSTTSREIYVERPDGTDWRLVTLHGAFPAWSPDGTKFAYICVTPVVWAVHLCVMNTDGTDQHQIAARSDYTTPAWSPDGTKIAFLSSPPLPNSGLDVRVNVINANGTNLRRLAPRINYHYYDCGPAWSPNGKQIAFSRLSPFYPNNDARRGGIYLMSPDGRNVVHLKGTTGFTCGISWQRTPA